MTQVIVFFFLFLIIYNIVDEFVAAQYILSPRVLLSTIHIQNNNKYVSKALFFISS